MANFAVLPQDDSVLSPSQGWSAPNIIEEHLLFRDTLGVKVRLGTEEGL